MLNLISVNVLDLEGAYVHGNGNWITPLYLTIEMKSLSLRQTYDRNCSHHQILNAMDETRLRIRLALRFCKPRKSFWECNFKKLRYKNVKKICVFLNRR